MAAPAAAFHRQHSGMSQSAESVQDTADLDSRVDAMLREADAVAENGAVVRQRAVGDDGVGDDGVGAAAEDAAQRRDPEFEDAASVLGDLDGSPDGSVAGIEALDAMLAERAAATIGADAGDAEGAFPEPEPKARAAFDEPDLGNPEPASPAPEGDGEPRPEPALSRAPAQPIAEPAAVAAATVEREAEPKAGEDPATAANADTSPRAKIGIGAAVAGALGPVAERTLGGVSRRLERLSPTARQTISWTACLTALNAAAVWTVIVLRWSAPAVPPKGAEEPAGGAERAHVESSASKSAKAATKDGGGH